MRRIALVMLVFSLAAPLSAGVNTWTSNGPDGGEISAMAVDPSNPNVIYVGLGDVWDTFQPFTFRTGGGIYKSTDGGATWTEANGTTSLQGSSLRLRFAVSSLFVESATSVYAVLDADTVYRSTDGGASWSAMTAFSGVLPTDLVAGGGSVYVSSIYGIYRSVAGATYTKVSTKDTRHLAINRTNPNIVIGAGDSGAWWTSDGGTTWTDSTGLVDPVHNYAVRVWALFMDTNGDVYAMGESDFNHFLFRSTDGGKTFTSSQPGFRPSRGELPDYRQALTRCGGSFYFVTQWSGVLKSATGGAWTRLTAAPGHAESVVCRNSTSVLVGGRGTGVYASTDSGATWSPSSSGLHGTRVYRVVVHPTNASIVYAATNGGVFKSTDAGATWTPMRNGMVDDANDVPPIFDVAVDSNGGLLAGGWERVFTSSDGGATWVTRTGSNLVDPGSNIGYTVRAVAIDPATPSKRYLHADNGAFYRSTDSGATWVMVGDTSVQIGCCVLTASHATGANLPVLHSAQDSVWRSADDGATWQSTNPTQLMMTSVATMPRDPSIVYIGGSDGVYKSIDAGLHYTVTALVPDYQYSYWRGSVVGVAPANGQIAFAYADKNSGTVHKTSDGGATWTPTMTGMMRWLSCETWFCDDDGGSIFSFAFSPDATTAYAGTAGHGVYSISSGSSAPSTPTGVVATASSTTSVSITWNAVSSATGYDLERRAAGGSFTTLGSATTNSYTDNTAAAGAAYLYRVRARNSGGTSAWSTADLATTILFTDDPLVVRSTSIKSVHMTQLRTAVNAVRSLAGLTASTFTGTAAVGTTVAATHINELRTAVDAARSTLGLTTGGFTDTIAASVSIKAVHFQELRNRVK